MFHYNGHGVPKPTVNGEIWVFNKVNRLNKKAQLREQVRRKIALSEFIKQSNIWTFTFMVLT